MALRKMGSSVFHGGFSTFLAILVLAPGSTYIFIVFFRCWFGIIFFGLANGFILLPVLLSLMGPTSTMEDTNVIDADQNEHRTTEPDEKSTKVQPEEHNPEPEEKIKEAKVQSETDNINQNTQKVKSAAGMRQSSNNINTIN